MLKLPVPNIPDPSNDKDRLDKPPPQIFILFFLKKRLYKSIFLLLLLLWVTRHNLIGVDVAFDGLRKKCGPKFLCKDLFVIFVYDNKLSTYFCTTLSLLQISVTIRLILLFSPNKKKEKNRRAIVSCLLCCFFESSYCYHLQNSYHRGSSFFTSVVFDPL